MLVQAAIDVCTGKQQAAAEIVNPGQVGVEVVALGHALRLVQDRHGTVDIV
jgi:hypothetical protein